MTPNLQVYYVLIPYFVICHLSIIRSDHRSTIGILELTLLADERHCFDMCIYFQRMDSSKTNMKSFSAFTGLPPQVSRALSNLDEKGPTGPKTLGADRPWDIAKNSTDFSLAEAGVERVSRGVHVQDDKIQKAKDELRQYSHLNYGPSDYKFGKGIVKMDTSFRDNPWKEAKSPSSEQKKDKGTSKAPTDSQ